MSNVYFQENLDSMYLDVAVLCKEYSPIELESSNNHTVELDDILITESTFRHIFYPNGECFGINELLQIQLNHYISFLYPFRKVLDVPFSLLNTILSNIEEDLNISRNCILTSSLIEITNELTNIRTLKDLRCCDIINSLTWTNICSIIRNSYIISNKTLNYAILVISVVFKSPNCQINPTIIKFKYRLNINSSWI
jgi:hypothetical protein